MASEIPPRILRDLARQREATRAAREAVLDMPPQSEPETDRSAFDGLSEEDTGNIAREVLAGMARQQQATLPDSDPPPSSGPPPVLSVALEGGRHVRVRGGLLAALVVVVVGIVLTTWLVTR